MKVTAIVLAGGKSLRLGRNKALEPFLGKSLIEHVVDRLRPLSAQLLIVTSGEQDLPPLDKTEALTDVYPGKGPLGGIYTGLLAARCSHSIVVGCDMPFINTELLRSLADLAPKFDVVIPRLSKEIIEPLHAVYAKSCLDKIKILLEKNQLEIHSLLNTLHIRYIKREECLRFDPQLRSFLNINNQTDLDRALALANKSNEIDLHNMSAFPGELL
ncbi:MAG: molybdenum cofactor guanylyltransferase [Dehalococcoidales bacterium]|nr:molybdenum cofactor guanylyltransferase [Dehalococcoidales bacterium]